MKNINRSHSIVGTLRSANGVEYVKKCVLCNGSLIVATDEQDKDRHDLCELAFQETERQQVAEWLAR